MGKVPLKIDWNDILLPRDDEAPPPEVEVVKSNGDLLVANLSDQKISEKIQRFCFNLSSMRERLPDKGAKPRAKLRQLQDETDRRKLAKSRKDAEKSEGARLSEATESPGIHNDSSPAIATESQQPSFASLFYKKLEERLARMSCRSSPFQCASSIADKDSNCRITELSSARKSFFGSLSKRKASECNQALNPKSRKVQDVVLFDEEVEPKQPVLGDTSNDWKEARIYYPSREDPESIELSHKDIICLDPEQYLTSPIMNFYIRYLQKPRSLVDRPRGEYHLFKTYFFSKLHEAVSCKVVEINSQSVQQKNIKWTTAMDICATDELFVQMHKGNKIDTSFTNLAYQTICSELFAKSGVRVSVGHLKNRLKTLKMDLAALQDIQTNGSGFSFNRVTRMMDAEPKVWKDYRDPHPEGKPYQHKYVPSSENMLLLGNDRDTGKDVETIKEKCIRLEREREESNSISSNQEGDKKVEHDDVGDFVGAPSIHKRIDSKITSTSSKFTYKRKHAATSISEDFQALKNGLDLVASAISKCFPHAYNEEELFEEVSKVEGLDEDGQILAYDYLCGDAVRGRTFIGLPISKRKRWLELKTPR